MPAALENALGSLTPPPRFAEARLSSYQSGSDSQREALRAARAFAQRLTAPPSWAERLRAWWPGSPPRAARGLYLVGPAGTGKTHLMAAAFHRLTRSDGPSVPCAFLHSSAFFRSAAHPERLGAALADALTQAGGAGTLMLDEVELDDAANEARLAHFLRTLSRRGVALMATSNARPNEFLSRHVSGGGAHRRFLADALGGRCETVLVRGDDRRHQETSAPRGAVFVGPPAEARAALRDACRGAAPPKRWLPFPQLRRAATEMAHARLLDELLATERLYVADVRLEGTDDALRLLRLVDDLYTAEAAPALFFSAPAPPEDWFTADAERGLRAGIAEKFARTVSRLHELCAVQPVDAGQSQRVL